MLPFIFSRSYLRFLRASRRTLRGVVTDVAPSIEAIDWMDLRERGIGLLVFDYDDTLAGHREALGDGIRTLLKGHSEAGEAERFHLAILSNRTSARDQVKLILDDTVLYFRIGTHRKPHPEAFFPVLREHGIGPEAAAMVGDRGGTDMWGAFELGFGARILVRPYSERTGRNRPPLLFRCLRAWENARVTPER